jgi:hypothetical protein
MYRNIPTLSEGLSNNIGQLQDIRDDLDEQATAVEDAVLDVAKTDAEDIIENTILPEKQLIQPTAYVLYGGTFGSIAYGTGNITDWGIWYDVTPPLPAPPIPVPTLLYSYTPGDYPDLDQLVSDYAYGNELLTKPLDTDGTYGIYAQIDNADTAISLLGDNKSMIDAGEGVFSRYIP